MMIQALFRPKPLKIIEAMKFYAGSHECQYIEPPNPNFQAPLLKKYVVSNDVYTNNYSLENAWKCDKTINLVRYAHVLS